MVSFISFNFISLSVRGGGCGGKVDVVLGPVVGTIVLYALYVFLTPPFKHP